MPRLVQIETCIIICIISCWDNSLYVYKYTCKKFNFRLFTIYALLICPLKVKFFLTPFLNVYINNVHYILVQSITFQHFPLIFNSGRQLFCFLNGLEVCLHNDIPKYLCFRCAYFYYISLFLSRLQLSFFQRNLSSFTFTIVFLQCNFSSTMCKNKLKRRKMNMC